MADPLRRFRSRFAIADDALVYLDGNSLGRLPLTTAERVAREVSTAWGEGLVRSWETGWMELPVAIGDELGAAALGAAPGQIVVGDSTTVCFYKLASAALELRPGRCEILADIDNFPTDRYVLEGLAAARGLSLRWLSFDADAGPDADAVADALGADTALVTFSHVSYRSGWVAPMAAINAAARDAGALTLWDLSHSAGSVPVELDEVASDFAVGCTYKYLNGGPGAPAFMYVRSALLEQVRQPIWGWLGREQPFAMAPGYRPAGGVLKLLSGTPPVLSLVGVQEGVRLVAEAGLGAIREKGIALTAYACSLVDELLPGTEVRIASPRDPLLRGAHVALAHPDAEALCAALIERGVIPDFRRPDVIRFGFSPLSTRFTDVYDGVAALAELLA